jgi:5-methylcytosine-specific restriction protein B
MMTDLFRNKIKKGDIIIASKGNLLVRGIARVTGEYEFREREGTTDYCHRRNVEWLWTSADGLDVHDFYEDRFVQRTLYNLNTSRLKVSAIERFMNTQSGTTDTAPESHVLIIDEINRANISKVFGELITLLEPDKRLGRRDEIQLTLPYSKKRFGVPQNLHIIGTMNTADRSIALLDTALRRRFTFKELMPNPAVLSPNVGGINLQKLLTAINDRIEYLFDREHQIGHAYFTGCKSAEGVEDVMRHKVIPLLSEYFYEDWSKVAAVLGDGPQGPSRFLEARRLAAPPEIAADDFSGERLRWRVKDQFDFSEFSA